MPHIAIYHSVMIVLIQEHQGTMFVEVAMVDLAKTGSASVKSIGLRSKQPRHTGAWAVSYIVRHAF